MPATHSVSASGGIGQNHWSVHMALYPRTLPLRLLLLTLLAAVPFGPAKSGAFDPDFDGLASGATIDEVLAHTSTDANGAWVFDNIYSVDRTILGQPFAVNFRFEEDRLYSISYRLDSDRLCTTGAFRTAGSRFNCQLRALSDAFSAVLNDHVSRYGPPESTETSETICPVNGIKGDVRSVLKGPRRVYCVWSVKRELVELWITLHCRNCARSHVASREASIRSNKFLFPGLRH